ncbi:MAG: triose-phosphate isomerase [Deltaproteobacteria bacterium]|nr:triose-phosphate isomerase [Deltaproteobacteria bacterium]
MKNKLIIANWKMNSTVTDALKFLAVFRHEMKGMTPCEVVLCPPFTCLYALGEAFEETPFKLGAQNMHWEESGAFTGEISSLFLKDLNVQYVLLGHSERRTLFGETDININKKLEQAIHQKITPVVCVGETDEEHKEGKTFAVLEHQIKKALDGQIRSELATMVWAYEPVWAIGTGKNATPDQAQEVISWMRTLLAKVLDDPTASTMRILYGGSVSAEKARGFLKQSDIDGLLVGGASLDPQKFANIVQSAQEQNA